MSARQYVGSPARPTDGLEKVMGRARYVGDMTVAGMLHARVLRSPVPHARIVELDVTPALRVPGVLAALTCEDFVDRGNFGWPVKDDYVLAWKKVRYVGDAIAAVAAESEQAAQEGLRAIRLVLEELPVVSDPERALDPDAPVIPDVPPLDRGNLVNTHLVRYGEPDPILAQCAHILDETYTFAHQEHAYLETEGALAIPGPDGSLTVYCNDQSPFINRDNLMMLLGLPADRVRVIQPPVGGSFGGKDDIGYRNAATVGKLALKTGRAVRLVIGREESLMASYKREAMRIHLTLGADADGILQAAKADILADSGAYASMTPLASWRATVHAAGAYRYRAAHVDTRSVYTNNGYSGAFRGFGNTEAVGAIEQAIDELAARLGQDPFDFRLKNIVRTGDRAMTGNPFDHEVHLGDCLQWAREASGWDSKRPAYAAQTGEVRRGIGVACYMHGSSLGGEGADYATTTLRIEEDGTISLASGLTDYGQGSRTVFALIAAESLGISPSRIRVQLTDTAVAVESGPTVASRASMLGGNATRVAGAKLHQVLTYAAADYLRCDPLRIHRHGDLFIGPNEDPLTFDDVVRHAREMNLTLYVQGRWSMPKFVWDFERGKGVPYFCYTFGAQVAEVEVDTLTGALKVLGLWASHDGGTIIFPQGAFAQMVGGVAQGMGYAILEEMKYVNGYPVPLNFDRYLIPSALDVPQVTGTFLQFEYAHGPYGAKNLAEPMMIATAPAIANALYQATGRRHRVVPMEMERRATGLAPERAANPAACAAALGGR